MEPKSNKNLMFVGILALAILLIAGFFLMKSKENTVSNKNLSASVSTASVEVGNALPYATSPSLNGGATITLVEGSTTVPVIAVTGTITDDNGCNDIASVNVAVYKDGATCSVEGDSNLQTCYFATVASSSLSGCSGGSDTDSALSHDFTFQYYAEPGTWYTTLTPIDTVATGTPATSSAVTLNGLLALAVSPTLSYGSVSGGATSTGSNTITTTNTGNSPIDFDVYGEALTCDNLGNIPVGNQEWSLSGFSYGAGASLTTGTSSVDADLPAPSSATTSITDLTYWQVSVPNGVRGTCSGNVTFAVKEAVVALPFVPELPYIMDGGNKLYIYPVDNSTGIEWGGYGTAIGSEAQSDTDGSANTATIVSVLETGTNAARTCSELSGEAGLGYDDWYLPAKDQLDAMYTQKGSVNLDNYSEGSPAWAGFASDHYWSSTEHSGNPAYNAWLQSFSYYGSQVSGYKNSVRRVRCVR